MVFHLNDSNAEPRYFPHSKRVKIGNNVEIFTYSAFVGGILSDTIIGDWTKIHTFVHVAHNVIIEKNMKLLQVLL